MYIRRLYRREFATRYCRPLQFFYEKETSEVIRNEVEKTENKIIELKSLDLGMY